LVRPSAVLVFGGNGTMFRLKPISRDAVPKALAKAERYRLLNEPWEAESICRDVLAAEPDHQDALVALALVLTDQFEGTDQAGAGAAGGLCATFEQVRELLTKVRGEYDRHYCTGVAAERWAKAQLRLGTPGHVVYDWVVKAMEAFERAEAVRPAGNDDALLRWNTCVRLLESAPQIRPRPEDADEGSEDVPFRGMTGRA
jgi:hypothetical protein